MGLQSTYAILAIPGQACESVQGILPLVAIRKTCAEPDLPGANGLVGEFLTNGATQNHPNHDLEHFSIGISIVLRGFIDSSFLRHTHGLYHQVYRVLQISL